MNKYEVLYILKTGLEQKVYDELADKYSAVVTSEKGEVESVNKWGTRKFAYPIDYKKDGYYVLMTFSAEPKVAHEMERRFRIDENVVRFMTIAI
ncbi:MAG: 30S ribosomal protein S6 [Firmicutes bacterium]|nr:30S ribosomal protein S6 [Bacillota bacterium]